VGVKVAGERGGIWEERRSLLDPNRVALMNQIIEAIIPREILPRRRYSMEIKMVGTGLDSSPRNGT
jgi:hypothetical protein